MDYRAGHPPSQSGRPAVTDGSSPQDFQQVGGRGRMGTGDSFHVKTCGTSQELEESAEQNREPMCPAGVEETQGRVLGIVSLEADSISWGNSPHAQ